MRFPLWHYLNQPLLDKTHPFILNPTQYWQRYQIRHLNRCLNNAFLETCWRVNYQRFVIHYKDFCSRNALEEDPRWLVERCWAVERRPRTYQHPEH
ncbi:MAG: hypothetical protein AAFY26_20930 [Cyanobacteria bacterium J06638_22]